MKPLVSSILFPPLALWLDKNLRYRKLESVLVGEGNIVFVFDKGINLYFRPKTLYSFLVVRKEKQTLEHPSWEHFFRNLILSSVEAVENERIIIFHLLRRSTFRTSEQKLIFEFFGARGNIILTKDDNTILFSLRSFKNRSLGIGEIYKPPSSLPKNPLAICKEKIGNINGTSEDLLNKLTGPEFKLPYFFADELVRRARKYGLTQALVDLAETVSTGKEGTSIIEGELVPFRYTGELPSIYYSEFTEGASEYFWSKWQEEVTKTQTQKSLKLIKRKIEKLQKQIENLRENTLITGEPSRYRLIGQLILMNKSNIQKGTEKIELTEPQTGEKILVALQPDKDAHWNATFYFKLARKAEKRSESAKKILPQKEKELQKLLELETQLKEGKLEKSGKPTLSDIEKHPQKRKKRLPFIVYRGKTGKLIFVGTSSRSNELLTFKYGRPDDLWFHIDGARGAHIILRSDSSITSDDIVKAASIAAYYSELKNEKNATVIYTKRKNVKKLKGGPQGSVIVGKAKKITVKPALPSDGSFVLDK